MPHRQPEVETTTARCGSAVRLTVTVDPCACHHDLREDRVRFVPKLGPFREASAHVVPTPQYARFPLLGGDLMAAVTMTATQEFECTISPVDKKGNPATLDGVPEWLTDNPAVLALTPAADGLSCKVTAVGMIGVANVQVTGDADMGAGSTPIIGTIDCEVTAGQAIMINITPGAPSEQPG